MKLAVMLTAGFLALGAKSHAQSPGSALETSLQMQSWCASFATVRVGEAGRFKMPDSSDSLVCWGAFASIQELSRLTDDSDKPILGVCTRTTSTRIQDIKIFLQYASRHPEQADLDFALVTLRALREAFPCS
jgi:hypothetical protein